MRSHSAQDSRAVPTTTVKAFAATPLYPHSVGYRVEGVVPGKAQHTELRSESRRHEIREMCYNLPEQKRAGCHFSVIAPIKLYLYSGKRSLDHSSFPWQGCSSGGAYARTAPSLFIMTPLPAPIPKPGVLHNLALLAEGGIAGRSPVSEVRVCSVAGRFP